MAVAHITTAGATATSATGVSVDADTATADHVNAFLLWRNDGQTISSLTREGAAMTQVGTDDTDSGERVSTGCRRSAGAGTATDTFAATISASSTALRIQVTTMSGVDTTTPVASADTNANLASANAFIDTDATTVASGNLALSAVVVRDNVAASLADDGGAATTDRDAITNIISEITTYMVSFTDTRTVRFSWTEPAAGNWAKVMTVVYAQSSGGAAGQPTIRRWQGVPFMRLGGTTFGNGWTH